MLSRPDILKTITDIDRHRSGRAYRTLDDGDLSSVGSLPSVDGGDNNVSIRTMEELSRTVTVLSKTLSDIQQRGIPAFINKYGKGGLIDEVESGLKFAKKYK